MKRISWPACLTTPPAVGETETVARPTAVAARPAAEADTADVDMFTSPARPKASACAPLAPIVGSKRQRGGADRAILAAIKSGCYVGRLFLPHMFQRTVKTEVGTMRLLEMRNPSLIGPTWVFVHGFSAQAFLWHPVMRRAYRHCARIIAPDLPGHGFSDVPAGLNQQTLTRGLCQTVRHALGNDAKAAVIVHSLGGMTAPALVNALGSERVVASVLLNPAGAPPTCDADTAHVMRLFQGTRQSAQAVVDASFPRGITGRQVLIRLQQANLGRPHLQALVAQYPSLDFLGPEHVQSLDPCLVVVPKDDPVFPSVSTEFWRANIGPRSEIKTPDLIGHGGFYERPAETVMWVKDFIASRGGPSIKR